MLERLFLRLQKNIDSTLMVFISSALVVGKMMLGEQKEIIAFQTVLAKINYEKRTLATIF